jgi:3-mercaptopyruvate sulfurtransferase SseA
MSSQKTDNTVIRASELGEFVYCARAWWLRRVQGVESQHIALLQVGRAAHDQHGRAVARVAFQRRLAIALIGLAAVTAVAAVVAAMGGGA